MDSLARAVLESWTIDPWIILLLLLSAWIYLRGWLGLRRLQPHRFTAWRLASFLAGLLVLWLAIASPLDALGSLMLSVHMTQHLLLMLVAPPLILMGYPAIPMLRGLPNGIRKNWLGPFIASRGVHSFFRFLVHPVTAWIGFVVMTWAWHVPAFYELGIRSDQWHAVEHACFVVTGLLFWFPVIQPWPSTPIWPRGAMIVYLLLADIQNTIFSAIFSFSDRIIYPSYRATDGLMGIDMLDDQALAGAIMWVPGSLLMFIPVGFIAAELMRNRSLARPARPTREISLPVFKSTIGGAVDLAAAPVAGHVIRSRKARYLLRLLMLVLAAALVVDGLAGPSVPGQNLAGVLPWTYWRGFSIIALLMVGNLFCMTCPFIVPRSILRRWLPANVPWPRWLRTKWIAAILVLAWLISYEVLGLWSSPWVTAWIVIGYFLAATIIDCIFRGASFCKYVCPIGQFHFLQSMLSPFVVTVRRPSVCATCTTQECIKGSASVPGCQLELFQPRKIGNLDCTFCMDCMDACPHGNIGLIGRPVGTDPIDDQHRSSVGRLGHRIDLSFLAMVLCFGAFANAAGMTQPMMSFQLHLAERFGLAADWPVILVLLLVQIVLLPILILMAAAGMTSLVMGPGSTRMRLAARMIFALLPMGISMWIVHFGFHLLTGAWTAVPVIHRALLDVGVPIGGAPAWGMSMMPSLVPGWIASIELLLLNGGLVCSLVVAWRILGRQLDGGARTLVAWMPWAVLAGVMFAWGAWIIFQPMEMRGMLIP